MNLFRIRRLSFCLWCLISAASALAHTLETPALRLTINEAGELTELIDRRSGHNYAGGWRLWRMYVERGQHFQEEVVATGDKPIITAAAGRLTIEYPSVVSKKFGTLPVRLRLSVRVDGDEARWSAEVENGTADTVVKELQYPLIGDLRLQADQALIISAYGGQRYPDPKQIVREGYPLTMHWYQKSDHESWQTDRLYPGSQAATNSFVFSGKKAGLYFACYDTDRRETLHLWRLYGEKFESGFVKHLYTPPGGRAQAVDFVISAYAGDWHVAADKYRAWCDTWFKPIRRPGWLTHYHGWQRLIFKHQDGDILFRYDDMPRIFTDGAKAGVKSLFLFGWWPGGFDRSYPDYVADPEMGGEDGLRRNIRTFQDDLGGTVILYASGRLIGRSTDFFARHGAAMAIKTRTGAEARDSYNFANAATFERRYGAPELTPVCLLAEGWVDVLKQFIRQTADLGCKGAFFDQLGLIEQPCWDPRHGHAVPYIQQTNDKMKIIAELRDYARQLNPELGIGIEVLTDVTASVSDFTHGLYHQGYLARNQDYQQKGERPRYPGFVEWTRYLFPDVLVSDRDIRDGHDVERRVNYALLVGLLNDVEIYRCRRTIAEIPHYQNWLGQVNAFRGRHLDLLAPGNYRDTLGFTLDNENVDARAYVRGDQRGVLLTQSHLAQTTAMVRVPAGTFLSGDAMGGATVERVGDAAKVTLPRHGVALVIFRRAR